MLIKLFNKILKNKKIIAATLMLFFVFSITPIALHADTAGDLQQKLNSTTTGVIGGFTSVLLTGVLKQVNSLLAGFLWVVGVLMILLGKLIGVAIGITLTNDFYSEGLIGTGFRVSLQVADMFFLLVMVIIGIATIMQYESYNLKKTLPTLIMIALVINFSMPIGQFIIGFTDDLTLFFFDKGLGGNVAKVGDMFLSLIAPQAFIVDAVTAKGESWCDNAAINGVIGLLGGPIGTTAVVACLGARAASQSGLASMADYKKQLEIMSSLMLAIIIFLIATAYLAVGIVLFLTRTVMLWALLIVAPLAWLAGIIPNTAHYMKTWWQKFFNWAFFAPIFALSLYIGITIITNQAYTDLMKSSSAAADSSTAANGFFTLAAHGMGSILSVIVVFIVFFGGMFAALKMAGSAGESVVKGTGAAKNWALGRAKQRFAAPVMMKTGEKIARVPGLKTVGGALMLGGAKYKGEQKGEFESKYKNMSNLTPDQQKTLVKNTVGSALLSGQEKAFALSKLREGNAAGFKEIVGKDSSAREAVRRFGSSADKDGAIRVTGDVSFKLSAEEMKDQNKVAETLKKAFAGMTPDEAKKTDFAKVLSPDNKEVSDESRVIIAKASLSQMSGDTLSYLAQANPESLKALQKASLVDNSGESLPRGAARERSLKNMMRPEALKYISNSPYLSNSFGVSRHVADSEKEYRDRRKRIADARKKQLAERSARKEAAEKEGRTAQQELAEFNLRNTPAPKPAATEPVDIGLENKA